MDEVARAQAALKRAQTRAAQAEALAKDPTFPKGGRAKVIGPRTGPYQGKTGTVYDHNDGEVGLYFGKTARAEAWFTRDELARTAT